MILYSHKFDFIAKLILAALLIATLFFFDIKHLEQQILSQFNLKMSQATFIIYLGILAEMIILWLLLYLPFLSPLASWFYMRFTLKTKVSWTMAKQLSPFLTINFPSMQWMPLLFIKDLPEEERMAALTDIIHHAKKENTSRFDLFLREKLSKKAYNLHIILTAIAALWHLYGSIDNSGMVGYLNNLEADLFSNSYYPALNFVFALFFSSLLAAGIAFLFDRIFNYKKQPI